MRQYPDLGSATSTSVAAEPEMSSPRKLPDVQTMSGELGKVGMIFLSPNVGVLIRGKGAGLNTRMPLGRELSNRRADRAATLSAQGADSVPGVRASLRELSDAGARGAHADTAARAVVRLTPVHVRLGCAVLAAALTSVAGVADPLPSVGASAWVVNECRSGCAHLVVADLAVLRGVLPVDLHEASFRWLTSTVYHAGALRAKGGARLGIRERKGNSIAIHQGGPLSAQPA